ncbi:MAG: ammonia channel protein [Micavibrio aeruginosavorus]|uniref:Ammonium transporter n=1 Tax=Micavibrio aeruginosavorus TaxID=349221 RepID=A0A2W5HTC3_9BACT|nr:MAG: ammonia channel protein [Micavibrio aeruginosavorus]
MNKLKVLSSLLTVLFALMPVAAFAQDTGPALDSGDTAWMLTSSLLVLMMSVPGLALFYGGLVKRNNVLATLMQTVAVCAVVSLLWPVIGYSLVFTDGANLFVGGFDKLLLEGVTPLSTYKFAATIPESVFIMFQMTFAIITAALLLGSVADRIKFSSVLVFVPLWMLAVYAPVAHWVWGPGGFIGGVDAPDTAGMLGFGFALDFAGGTVVHIASGVAGLVAALVLGRSYDFHDRTPSPANIVMSLIGTGLLWVGWFGFNAGSALTAGTGAGMAMLVTNTSAAVACLAWIFAEWVHRGKPSVVGALSGVVSGLVAITPAAGFVGFGTSIVIGFAAGVVCFLACTYLKKWLKYDDSLDVFGIHGIGGIVGCILTGVFATKAIGPAAGLIEGNANQLIAQLISIVIVVAYVTVITFILIKVVQKVMGLRVPQIAEEEGLDMFLHGETYK